MELRELFNRAHDGQFGTHNQLPHYSTFKKQYIHTLSTYLDEFDITDEVLAKKLGVSRSTVALSRDPAIERLELFTSKMSRFLTRGRISDERAEAARRIMRTTAAESGRNYLVLSCSATDFHQKYVHELKKEDANMVPLSKDVYMRMFHSENYVRVQKGPRHKKCKLCREGEAKIKNKTITPAERAKLEAHKELITIQNTAHRRSRQELKT